MGRGQLVVVLEKHATAVDWENAPMQPYRDGDERVNAASGWRRASSHGCGGQVLFWNGKAIDVQIPKTVVLKASTCGAPAHHTLHTHHLAGCPRASLDVPFPYGVRYLVAVRGGIRLRR